METKKTPSQGSRRKDSDSPSSPLPKPPSPKSGQPVDDVFAFKLKLLAEAIQEIDRAIAQRKELNKNFRKQIEKEIKEIQYQMGFLQPPWRAGFIPKLEFIRITLHKSLTSRKTDKRSETLKCWEHTVSLLKDRRTLVMEYQELLNAQKKLRGGGI